MAKVFIGIALIVMLATAGLGFLAKGNIDKLQSALTTTKGRIAKAEADAKVAKSDAEKAQKEAKDASDKAEAATTAAAAATKEATEAKAAVGEKTQLVDSLTAKNKELEGKIVQMGTGGIEPAVVEKLKADLLTATTEKENAVKEVAEAKVALDSKIAQGKENETKVADLSKKLHDREVNYQKPGLQGHILAVNSGWNFVVLSVGDSQGVVINSTLLVVRANQPIARLRITSVEPSTSIADVMPGTVRRGTVIQPGDTVIFEGSRNQAAPAGKAPDATTAPPAITTPPLPNS